MLADTPGPCPHPPLAGECHPRAGEQRAARARGRPRLPAGDLGWQEGPAADLLLPPCLGEHRGSVSVLSIKEGGLHRLSLATSSVE